MLFYSRVYVYNIIIKNIYKNEIFYCLGHKGRITPTPRLRGLYYSQFYDKKVFFVLFFLGGGLSGSTTKKPTIIDCLP